jgi:aminoglycoside phosphotransferase (APT) family kinase protein
VGDVIRQVPHLGDDLRASVLDLLPALPDGDNLCHGDFHPGNVMLTTKGAVVIDWMTACSGSPWMDFTRTSLLLSIGPKGAGNLLNPLVRLVIELFHSIYVRHYLELMPDHRNEQQKWIPIVAAARLNERIEPETQALVEVVRRGLTPIA